MVAQELLKSYPQFVYMPTDSDHYIVNYDKLSVLSLKGIQELSLENVELRKENKRVKHKLDLLIQAWCEKDPTAEVCSDQHD